ncbi:MAG: HAD-IIIA family hydrolase [Solirubrobacterales bacterium]
MSASPPAVDVVVPTLGRDSLQRLLAALAPQLPQLGGGRLIVADDRRDPSPPLALPQSATVVRAGRRGPAAARNLGARAGHAEWISFLDDDVVPDRDWAERLVADLASIPAAVGASQGRLRVPLPAGRRPTDWERNVAGLERARWITADMAVRRQAFAAVGGFDERFAAAYREDTDLALRLLGAGWRIARGGRGSEHPVGEAGFWVSVGRQRGNADDVLMRALHGPHWRLWGGAPRGRLRRHLLTTSLLAGAAAAALAGRRRTTAACAAGWLAASVELAAARLLPGPRDRDELARMAATSTVLPLAASAWWAAGAVRLPVRLLRGGPRPPAAEDPGAADGATRSAPRHRERLEAVLLDRDGTIVIDVPYNGDPAKVVPVPGAKRALARLREAGLPLAVVSNQSGVARGLLAPTQVRAVNSRAEELLGPIDAWLFCPHGPGEGCECRKPEPGLVIEAAAALGVRPERCALIGDIAADVQAAQAAGALAVLVPTERTEAEDVRRAPLLAPDLDSAVDLLLGDQNIGTPIFQGPEAPKHRYPDILAAPGVGA